MSLVLLLGSSGQLGSDIDEVCNSPGGKFILIKPTRSELNIADRGVLRSYLESLREIPTYIINCTAMTNTALCEEKIEEAFAINAYSLIELAKFAKKKNIPLIHISTDYVFEGNQKHSYTENDETNPVNIYGMSKLLGEKILKAYCEKFFILRVSSLFGIRGASGKGGNFVEAMITKAKNGENLTVVDDQFMSPTHTLEIARVILFLMNSKNQSYGIYHFGGDGVVSWYQFTCKIMELLGMTPSISTVSASQFPSQLRRPQMSGLSCGKIKKVFPMKKWEDSLHEYLIRKGHI